MLDNNCVNCFKASTWLSVSGASGEPGEGFFNAATMSWMPAKVISFDDANGMLILVGDHDTVSQMLLLLVSQAQTVKHRYDSRAGPRYQPSSPCGAHVPRADGFSWMRTRIPGGAIGVRLKSNVPCNCAQADNFGLRRDARNKLSVSSACGSNWSHRCMGKC